MTALQTCREELIAQPRFSPGPDPRASTVSAADVRQLKIAIVHPWFITKGGGEKVVDALAGMYPHADFFALMVSQRHLSAAMKGRNIRSSFLDRVPGAKRFYQHFLPLYRMATQDLDVSGYDLVISSGGPAAKGVTVGQDAVHIHYCHSPVRFLWDQFPTWKRRLPALVRPFYCGAATSLREWDFNTAQRVDAFAANSNYIAKRISTYYRRESTTVYPPVDVSLGYVSPVRQDYYLTVGRLVPGKRVDLLIQACNKNGRKLVIVGSGPEEARLKAIAGPSIVFAGRVDDAGLASLYAEAKAFLFAADEDFGIATVEAQSYGVPAIVYGRGGSLEIVADLSAGVEATGILYPEQTVESLLDAIVRFEQAEAQFDRSSIRERSLRFGIDNFVTSMESFVCRIYEEKRPR